MARPHSGRDTRRRERRAARAGRQSALSGRLAAARPQRHRRATRSCASHRQSRDGDTMRQYKKPPHRQKLRLSKRAKPKFLLPLPQGERAANVDVCAYTADLVQTLTLAPPSPRGRGWGRGPSLMREACAFIFFIIFLISSPAHATDIQEVTSRGGVTAWLVEDHKLPLIAMHFAFRGGVEQDPVEKQGLATLTTDLMTEGAGPYDAAAFQQQLADNSISLHFAAERDALAGSVKSLSADKAKAFELLHLALTQAHFDAKDIERSRAEQLSALRVQFGNPGWQARYALFRQVFGDHPYGERRLGSVRSLGALPRGDIKKFAGDHLAPRNLHV